MTVELARPPVKPEDRVPYRVTRFLAADLSTIELQPEQYDEKIWDNWRSTGFEFEQAGHAFTLWREDGDVLTALFCGGAMERHAEYVTLWAVFSVHKPAVPLWLTRRVRAFVADLPHRRVDAMVHAGNHGALGWARLIGLRAECVLHGAAPDGGDMVVYARPPAARVGVR